MQIMASKLTGIRRVRYVYVVEKNKKREEERGIGEGNTHEFLCSKKETEFFLFSFFRDKYLQLHQPSSSLSKMDTLSLSPPIPGISLMME